VTAKEAAILNHNAGVLATRCALAIAEGNEAQAAKLARCAAVLVKLSQKGKN